MELVNSKSTLLIAIIALVLSLISFSKAMVPSRQSSFYKRVECEKYLGAARDRHKEDDARDGRLTFFRGVFYSPKLDTCFEAYYYDSVFVVRDILSGEQIYFSNNPEVDQSKEVQIYNQKIEELKGGQ